DRARGIEPGVRAQREEILRGNDGELPDRAQGLANERIGHGSWRSPQHGVDTAASFLVEAAVPAERSVVVVSAGVDDAVVLVHVGKVRVVTLTAEGELQHAHAGQAEALA